MYRYLSLLKNTTHLWLFFRVVPSVLSPVMCRESLKILNIRRMRKIWAAFAMYSREYWEESRFRKTDTKNGRIPRRSIILRNETTNSNCKTKRNLWNNIYKKKTATNLVRGHNESYQIFKSEPTNKDSLGHPEEIVFLLHPLGWDLAVLQTI